MRIVYDDAQLSNLVDLVKNIVNETMKTEVQVKPFTEYDYGTYRVKEQLVKKHMNRVFAYSGFEIGNDVYHANGIGNNNRYPVYYNAPEEKQQVGYINLIDDMYGSVYVYVTDYNQKKHGLSYKLTKFGSSVSR